MSFMLADKVYICANKLLSLHSLGSGGHSSARQGCI